MTGWTILLLVASVAWLSVLWLVWLLCLAAAKADQHDRAISAAKPEPELERPPRVARG